jgi:formylglycine-generating enzyme required for sulfatase activity
MLTEEGHVKIMDFGIAKLLTPSQFTSTSMAMGTAYYMAPEQQLDAAKVDGRADIFSVCVILYELLTGELPIGSFKTPSEIRKAIPRETDTVIRKSLEPRPEDRFASVRDLVAALRKIEKALPREAAPRKRSLRVPFSIAAILIAGIVIFLFRADLRRLLSPKGRAKEPATGRSGEAKGREGLTPVELARKVLEAEEAKRPVEFARLIPSTGAIVKGYAVEVQGRLNRDGVPFVTINNIQTDVVERNFSLSVSLREGKNRIKVVTAGEETVRAEKEVVITVDNAPPKIVVTRPGDGLITNNATLTVSGEIRDAHPLKVAVGGAFCSLDGPRFSAIVALQKGENRLEIVGYDRAGNEAKKTVRVTLDTVPPVITLDPYEDYIAGIEGAEIELSGRLSKPVEKLLVAGKPVSVKGRRFRAKVRCKLGRNRVVLEAFDRAGNQGTAKAEFEMERVRVIADGASEPHKDEKEKKEKKEGSGKEGSSFEEFLKKYRPEGSAGKEKPAVKEKKPTERIPADLWWTPTPAQREYARRTVQSLVLENSAGMKLVLIPPGSFTMGSPPSEKGREGGNRETQHKVTLTRGFYMSSTEVTNKQYRKFRATHDSKKVSGHSLNGERQPAVYVSWKDAVSFCDWLTRGERQAGRIGPEDAYRLPTEAEWEYACRAGTTTRHFWGDGEAPGGQYANPPDKTAKKTWSSWKVMDTEDGHLVTAPVSSFKPNAFGLYDMIGNVWEWCRNWYGDYSRAPATDPQGPSDGNLRITRGGSWSSFPECCRSAYRGGFKPDHRAKDLGFRVVLLLRKSGKTVESRPRPVKRPAVPLHWKPGGEQRAYGMRTRHPLVHENSLGMKFALIPPGHFTMGSPLSEKGREGGNKETQHVVTLTKGFYLGTTEVTNGQYRKFKSGHTSKSYQGLSLNGNGQPAVYVSWNDAVAFCDWLTKAERRRGKISSGDVYRLPTEAEWEYACRAGTTTRTFWGNDEKSAGRYANVPDRTAKRKWKGWKTMEANDGHAITAPVGSFRPNPFGLYDMIGNVDEWCRDWYGLYGRGAATDPGGPKSGDRRVARGASWSSYPRYCRSAFRRGFKPGEQSGYVGFRIVLDRDSLRRGGSPKRYEGKRPAAPLGRIPTRAQLEYARKTKLRLHFENSLTMKLVLIPPGTFVMGSPDREKGRNADETAHRVTLTLGFYMGAMEVTNGQYRKFRPKHSSTKFGGLSLDGDDQPVVFVSWNDAVAFCNWLTWREKDLGRIGPGDFYRLPTEAEWEYACRAGTTTSRFWGDDEESGGRYANGPDKTALKRWPRWKVVNTNDGHAVSAPGGRFLANAFGLYDMIGNVYEWCRDWYGRYPSQYVIDPTGPRTGKARVLRGGSWASYPKHCRSARRIQYAPERGGDQYGFRVVLVPGSTGGR